MERVVGNLTDRMIRAAKLDSSVYEEVERDTGATAQALTVVVIVAVAAGIGGLLAGAMRGTPGAVITGFILGVATGVLGWAIWSLVTYFVGTTLLGGTADYGEVLRTIGFAYTPNLLQIFSFIPILGLLIALIGAVWALVAGVVAIRQALDFTTGKAILTVVIGWVIMLAVLFLLALVGLAL